MLALAVGILLICAPGFAAAEIAALSAVQVVHAQRPAVIHLGAGAYDVSQDIGDDGFPDDSSALAITGPGGRVPVQSVPQTLSPAHAAGHLHIVPVAVPGGRGCGWRGLPGLA